MKRFIKLFLLILVVLTFNINVYAECFRLPVGDKQIVIPNGATARCFYTNIGGDGSRYAKNDNLYAIYFEYNYDTEIYDGKIVNDFVRITGHAVPREILGDEVDLYEKFYVDFSTLSSRSNRKFMDFAMDNGQILEQNVSAGGYGFSLDGIEFESAADGSGGAAGLNDFHSVKVYYDEITEGCPKYFYWAVNQYGDGEFTFRNEKKVPTFDSYSMYQLLLHEPVIDEDADTPIFEYYKDVQDSSTADPSGVIIYNDDETIIANPTKKGTTSHEKFNNEEYQEKINKCESIKEPEIIPTTPPELPGQEIIEVITCPYYFEMHSITGCAKTNVDLMYESKYYKHDVEQAYEKEYLGMTYKGSNSYFQNEIQISSKMSEDIANIEKIVGTTATYEGDYLRYNGSEILCSTKKLNIGVISTYTTIFGESEYQTYKNANPDITFFTSLSEPTGTCVDFYPDDPKPGIDWDDAGKTCKEVLGEDLIDFINKIFRWVCIIAPILVIVLGSVDFAGALLQDDKDAIKKASTKLIKRLIVAIAIFLIPIFLNFLFSIYETVTGKTIVLCKIWR